MSNLKQVLTDIQNEKNRKLIPSNIKAGVTIMDVTGTYDGGGGGEETPAFISFEGDNNTILICNYGGWSPEHVHAVLDEYLIAELIDALYNLYDANPEEIADTIQNDWDPEWVANIIHALNMNLETGDPLEEEGEQYFTQFFIGNDNHSDYTPYINFIGVEMTSSTSIDVYIPGICGFSIAYEVDAQTGDASLMVGEVMNLTIDTYEADAEPADVLQGKTFAARGEMLEGTLTVDTLPTINLTGLTFDTNLNCWVSSNTRAMQQLNSQPSAFILKIGKGNNNEFTYTATCGLVPDPEGQGNDKWVIKILQLDEENTTAEYHLSCWDGETVEAQAVQLRNVTFQIEDYH